MLALLPPKIAKSVEDLSIGDRVLVEYVGLSGTDRHVITGNVETVYPTGLIEISPDNSRSPHVWVPLIAGTFKILS